MSILKNNNSPAVSKKGRAARIMTVGFFTILMLGMSCMCFAVDGADTVKEVLNKMIEIVCLVFQAVGVVLSIYSVGQLVLAFKNEDADSKSRASTMLVVGVILIAIPSIINGLNLVDMIG